MLADLAEDVVYVYVWCFRVNMANIAQKKQIVVTAACNLVQIGVEVAADDEQWNFIQANHHNTNPNLKLTLILTLVLILSKPNTNPKMHFQCISMAPSKLNSSPSFFSMWCNVICVYTHGRPYDYGFTVMVRFRVWGRVSVRVNSDEFNVLLS